MFISNTLKHGILEEHFRWMIIMLWELTSPLWTILTCFIWPLQYSWCQRISTDSLKSDSYKSKLKKANFSQLYCKVTNNKSYFFFFFLYEIRKMFSPGNLGGNTLRYWDIPTILSTNIASLPFSIQQKIKCMSTKNLIPLDLATHF